MTEAQLQYGEELRYTIHDFLEDRPDRVSPSAVDEYVTACRDYALREVKGNFYLEDQIALIDTLPKSQQDLLFVHMANSRKTLRENAAAIGLSSGQARVRFLYAVRNHRNNQPGNRNIVIDYESDVDEILAEEAWEEVGQEMLLQGFSGEDAVEDLNIFFDRRAESIIKKYGLAVPMRTQYFERANLYYGRDTGKARDTAKDQYRGYLAGAVLYHERPISAIQAATNLPTVYPAITAAPLHKWFKHKKEAVGKFPDVMEKIMRFERNYPHAFDDEAAEAFLRDGFGTLLGVLLMHTGDGWRGRGIAGETDRSRYVVMDTAHEMLPIEIKQRMLDLGITEFLPKVLDTLPRVQGTEDEKTKVDVAGLSETPVTNQYIARLLDVFKYNHNIKLLLDELPESTKREFIASFLKEAFFENRMTYDDRPDNFLVASTLPNRSEILQWLYGELKQRDVVDKLTKSGKRDNANYLSLAFSIPSYKDVVSRLNKDPLPEESSPIKIYKRLEKAFAWQ